MIIHYVHHHPDACPMKRHYHLLELPDTHFRLIGVGSIRTFRHVVVFRVISPVVLRSVELGFIHRRKVERWQQLHVCHTQFLQMVNTCFLTPISMGSLFSQGQKFPPVPDTGNGIDRKVTVMQFIDYHISEMRQGWTLVFIPSFGIRFFPVNDSSPVSIHSYSFCHKSGSISLPHVVHFHIERVELPFQIFVYSGLP